MQISRELDYAIRAVVVLAGNRGGVISKREIAARFEIPMNFLGIILPKLAHARVVNSVPGPHGGYTLARDPKDISIYDICCAIERTLAISRCQDPSHGCNQSYRCPVSPYMKKLKDNAESFFKDIRFDGLARDFNEKEKMSRTEIWD